MTDGEIKATFAMAGLFLPWCLVAAGSRFRRSGGCRGDVGRC